MLLVVYLLVTMLYIVVCNDWTKSDTFYVRQLQYIFYLILIYSLIWFNLFNQINNIITI